MQEPVQLDILGEDHIDFNDDSLVHAMKDLSRLRIARTMHGRRIAANIPISYRSVEWIGIIRTRQAWALAMAAVFMPLGVIWIVSNYGNWGPFGVSAVVFLMLGAWPLAIYLHGRPFLGIASDSYVIVVPMDRQVDKVRRILGLLAQVCDSSAVRWELGRGRLAKPKTWDSRPRQDKPYNVARYIFVSTMMGALGLGNFRAAYPSTRPYAIIAALVFATLGSLGALGAHKRNTRK